MFIEIETNQTIADNGFVRDEITYPPGWLALATSEDLANLGIRYEQDQPVTEIPLNPIIQQINQLEAKVTTRRIREAVLGIDGGWLADLNTQITALRAQL